MARDFDKEAFNRNDKVAKEAVISFMKTLGEYEVKENPGYGVDLVVFCSKTDECVGYIEVERAETWWTYEGKYEGRESPKGKYFRIPGRKGHYLLGKDVFDYKKGDAELPYGPKQVMFATVNKHCTDVMLIMSDVVKEEAFYEDDKTSSANAGSKFICVPLKKCYQGKIK